MRSLVAFALITLLAVAHQRVSWLEEVQEAFRAEANADAHALQEDTKAIRLDASVAAPVWVKSQWKETEVTLKGLLADASADVRRGQSSLWTNRLRRAPAERK